MVLKFKSSTVLSLILIRETDVHISAQEMHSANADIPNGVPQ